MGRSDFFGRQARMEGDRSAITANLSTRAVRTKRSLRGSKNKADFVPLTESCSLLRLTP
jgi:hypothetical protein